MEVWKLQRGVTVSARQCQYSYIEMNTEEQIQSTQRLERREKEREEIRAYVFRKKKGLEATC